MKKLLSILIVVVLAVSFAFVLTACQTYEGDFRIALITDAGNIDDKSFNQGAWEGLVKFAQDNHMSENQHYKYFKPADVTDDDYVDAIELAIESGYNIIITPGFLFETAIYLVQDEYPDVYFILLDGAPHTADYSDFKTSDNVASVFYAEEEAGFLAGYAAVKEGFTKLGFMGGMAVPAVQAFGYGYLQGAEYAATEMGKAAGSITIQYHYTGNFEENSTNKATANTMFNNNVEVIFACGGSVGKSVFAAALEKSKKTIGVDVDQANDSTTVITSATKGLGKSVQLVLESIVNDDNFGTEYGGKSTYFDATNDGIGLPTADSSFRFSTFTKAQYDEIYAKIVAGTVNPIRSITVADTTNGIATKAELETGLSLSKVIVTTVA